MTRLCLLLLATAARLATSQTLASLAAGDAASPAHSPAPGAGVAVAQTLASLAAGELASPAPSPADDGTLWGGTGDDEDDEPPSSAPETADGGEPAKPRKVDARTKQVLSDPRVDPSSLSDNKGSFAVYGRYCGPGWTDRADRPGIDAVDEACHGHDNCYGDAYANTAPKSKERVKAECACDRALVKTLQAWKKDKAAVADVPPAGRKVAEDIITAMPAKCAATAVAGVFLPHRKAPSPAADGGSVLGR